MSWLAIVAVHCAATWYLVGLIWTIQVVHYPSFEDIDAERYRDFQQLHMRRMGAVVGPAWLVEGLSVLAVFIWAPDTTTRILATVGGVLELVVLLTTVRASIPAHEALTTGFAPDAHRRLLQTNWIRTAAWTVRGVLALVLLLMV
jgi:hypothetical protein